MLCRGARDWMARRFEMGGDLQHNPASERACSFLRATRLLAIATAMLSSTLLVASGPPEPDGIMAVEENGKRVYVNAPRAQHVAPKRDEKRRSVLVYWSSRERTWKPVPPATPSAMRAARNAADEVVNYVQSRPEEGSAVTIPKSPAVSNPNYRDLARGFAISTTEIDKAIEHAAKRHGVDANLVRALIKVESNFNPRAVSRKGAMGLMQLMPGTARELNVDNPFDPAQNVDAGVRHLKSLMNSFGGDVRLSLAAYNAGAGAVARSNGVPRYAETQNYVKQITNMYWSGKSLGGFLPATSVGKTAPAHMFRRSDGRLVITNED